jgi:UDP-glucose 4-epimerase
MVGRSEHKIKREPPGSKADRCLRAARCAILAPLSMQRARSTLAALAAELADVPVVLTGGNGFVGLALVDALLLARRAPLHVLDLHPLKPALAAHVDRSGATFHGHCVDLTDVAAVRELAGALPQRFALVHAASLVSTRQALDLAAVRELDVSAAMITSMIDAFASRIAALCFISSIDVYGNPKGPAFEEHSAYAPSRVYGVGKVIAEALLQSGSRTLGFPLCSLQLGHVYGRFEHISSPTHEVRAGRAIPAFLRNALQDRAITLNGQGEDLRDYVHVDDVAQAMLRALLRASTGTYLIASGQSVSMREVAETCVRVCESKSEIQFRPRSGERIDYAIAIDAARNALDYEPLVPLAAGLADEAALMRRVGMHV